MSAVNLYYRRSSSGPTDGYWQYELNGGTWTTAADVTNEFSSTSTGGASIATLSLAGIAALQNLAAGTVVGLRVTPYAATSSGGTWYVYDGGRNGTDLSVSAAAAANAVVTSSEPIAPAAHANTGSRPDAPATVAAAFAFITQSRHAKRSTAFAG